MCWLYDRIVLLPGWIMLLALWVPLALLGILVIMTVAQFAAERARGKWKLARAVASSSLKGAATRSLVLLAVLPAISLTLLISSKRVSDRETFEKSQVDEATLAAATQIDTFLERHVAGIRSAAEAIEFDARPSAERSGQWLLRYHPIYPDFLTMLVSGPSGNILTASRRGDGDYSLAQVATRNIRDRPYFREPMEGGGDYLSGAFRGRGLGTDVIVAISSPMELEGRFAGIVEGSLDVQAFRRLDTSYQKLLNAHVVIADQSGSVVYAHPETGLRALETLTRARVDELALRVAEGSRSGSDLRDALHVGYATTERGWSIYIIKPKATVSQWLASTWWVALGWLTLVAAVSGALAWSLARRLTRPLDKLAIALDTHQAGSRSPFRSFGSVPAEYVSINRHLHWLLVRLARRHREVTHGLARAETLQQELRTVIAEREEEVSARTRELASANRELGLLARTDPLTRLANRRWFEEEYARASQIARREAKPLSLLMIDVDFFKAFNDHYGHPAGDLVLQKLAEVLRESLRRPGDMAARFGGEEFVVLLCDTDGMGGREVAERIRAAIAGLRLAHQESPHGVVTVSIGVATPSSGEQEDLAEALRRADKHLYDAKASGRNRVCSGGPAGNARGQLKVC